MQGKLACMKDMTTHFSVTSETVRKWIKTKHLPARKIGRQWRFDWEEIIEWEKGQEACPVVFESNYKDYIPAECALSANREFRNEVVHGNERLINGDCLAAMKSIADENVDLLLTDPPYNLGLFMQDRATNLKQLRSNYFGAAGWDNLEPHEWSLSMDAFFKEASRVLKTGAAMIVFMAVIKLETLIDIAQKHGFYYKTTGTWHKSNPMPRNMNLHFVNSTETWVYFIKNAKTGTFNNKGKVLHDFFETSVTPKSEKAYGAHPTQKPIKLMRHFIEVLTNANDVVLDPFMGSGSAGVAALKADRSFIGIELDENYFDIACQRMDEVRP